jgi:hypothetical protein
MSVAGTSAIPYYYWCMEMEDSTVGGGEDRRHINKYRCFTMKYRHFTWMHIFWTRTATPRQRRRPKYPLLAKRRAAWATGLWPEGAILVRRG